MKTIILEEHKKISRLKGRLKTKLKIKITIKPKEILIEGSPEQEYIAEKVIEALSLGFPFDVALSIKEENNFFEIISIKDHTRRRDLGRIRARIIGTKGKTLKTLTDLTGCHFELKDNQVGIIGAPELIRNAQEAIISIIRGAKQANVYARLEKHRPEPILDLGLREKK